MSDTIFEHEPPHRITPIDDVIAGDSVVFGPFTVMEDGSPRDLTTDTLEWYLFETELERDPSNAVISHTDSDVVVEEPPNGSYADGEWQVFVEQGAMDGLHGDYWQRAIVDAADDTRQTWKGEVSIDP